jgi:hypothetical protein
VPPAELSYTTLSGGKITAPVIADPYSLGVNLESVYTEHWVDIEKNSSWINAGTQLTPPNFQLFSIGFIVGYREATPSLPTWVRMWTDGSEFQLIDVADNFRIGWKSYTPDINVPTYEVEWYFNGVLQTTLTGTRKWGGDDNELCHLGFWHRYSNLFAGDGHKLNNWYGNMIANYI